ncbi:hypothetical protein [Bradyrhizobium sp. LMG 9283]|uniref:hypothetical protein n=1 Tax=Bradyrhizobium sp. LMG 9283 TaxID=592064 RepID=UPI00388EB4FD
MKASLYEDILQPVIEALAPTGLGCPKTQAVISEHLELFETKLQQGYTYKQLAQALNAGGARGRKGAQFTDRSLYTCIARARASIKDWAPAEIHVRAGHNVATARTSRSDQDLPNSPELSEFKQRIRDAQSHAATGEVLFGRARRK